MGSIAARHGHDEKWIFESGAIAASVIWFAAVGWGARFLAPLFTRPVAARVLAGSTGAIMLALGARLVGTV